MRLTQKISTVFHRGGKGLEVVSWICSRCVGRLLSWDSDCRESSECPRPKSPSCDVLPCMTCIVLNISIFKNFKQQSVTYCVRNSCYSFTDLQTMETGFFGGLSRLLNLWSPARSCTIEHALTLRKCWRSNKLS